MFIFRAVVMEKGKTNDEKYKIVRYYSFGGNGCQYHFGRISHPLLF
jgi:hypothetical protein